MSIFDFFDSDAFRELQRETARQLFESEGWAKIQEIIAEETAKQLDFDWVKDLPVVDLQPELLAALSDLALSQITLPEDPDRPPRNLTGTGATILLAFQLASADPNASDDVAGLLLAAWFRLNNIELNS